MSVNVKGISLSRIVQSERIAGFVCASPGFFGLIAFTLGPIIAALFFSFTEYDVIRPPTFVGLENYREMLTGDELFWKTLGNTAFITATGVPLSMISGLLLALILNNDIRGMALYRTVFFLPSVVPVVANAVLWLWLFNTQYGLINITLRALRLPAPPWLTSEQWSKPAIVIMRLWATGQGMIIYLAGLKNIPSQFYEAAEIDGAGIWAKFRHITLPMLTPTLFFTSTMGIIAHFQVFTEAYVMTQGGPADSTLFYVYYLYSSAFGWFKMGYACAMAWILFIVILIVTLIQFRMARYWVTYELA
ncbi:MAG: carbohydrate ABC transporter permease [bacterium]